MKHRKAYLISLLATCIVCINILYCVNIVPMDEKGPIDLAPIYNINSMVNL